MYICRRHDTDTVLSTCQFMGSIKNLMSFISNYCEFWFIEKVNLITFWRSLRCTILHHFYSPWQAWLSPTSVCVLWIPMSVQCEVAGLRRTENLIQALGAPSVESLKLTCLCFTHATYFLTFKQKSVSSCPVEFHRPLYNVGLRPGYLLLSINMSTLALAQTLPILF